MNKYTNLISLILAAGAAGVAIFSLASAQFTAALRGDIVLGIGASVALVGFAIHDYSRRAQAPVRASRLLRPTLRAAAAACSHKNRLAA